MEQRDKVIIIIPARLGSTRLPGKPLLDIAGVAMIVRVWRKAMETSLGDVLVATDDEEIAAKVFEAGGEAIITTKQHPSGTDRVHEALTMVDRPGDYEIVVNLQGDLPLISAQTIRSAVLPLLNRQAAIGTVGYHFHDRQSAQSPSLVKIVATPIAPPSSALANKRFYQALYFSRALCPYGQGEHIGHIGVYGYRRQALERFVSLPPSGLEQRERLEQLRALENDMRIDFCLVDEMPVSIDTPADLSSLCARLER